MKLLSAVAIAALGLAACATARSGSPGRTVTLVSFSDYHSHAVPFYSEGRPEQAGIARAIAYFKAAKSRPDTVIVSGGDMMNLGSPTWSDEYRCAEWPWLNGLVDVMAFGNHDVDYGPEEFSRCLEQVTYPVLGANLMGPDGRPLLLAGGKPYLVKEVGGVRLGLFAVAGADFQRLVKKERLPPGAQWTEPLAEARRLVTALREVEKVDAVVFIGHQNREDDEAMAHAVPGIDVILGSHSHHKGELARIPGTGTYHVSPYQYLTYVAEVRLRFEGGKLAEVSGGLVRMDESLPEDPAVKARVAKMQRELERKHPERFRVLGHAAVELSDANVASGESLIGNWATGVLRQAAGAHVFTTTASSFRGSLPPGEVTVEAFHGAIPYKNTLVTAEVSGEQLEAWLAYSVSRMGADGFSQQSGARYRVRDGKPVELQVLKDPARLEAGYVPVDPAGTYTLATTDFQAFVAQGYRELFATFRDPKRTGKDVHAELMAALEAEPARAELDGRDGGR